MAENNEIMRDAERVEITPAEGDDDLITPAGTEGAAADGDGEDTDAAHPSVQRGDEELVRRTPADPAPKKEDEGDDDGNGDQGAAGGKKVGEDGLTDVPGETPRERELRRQLKIARDGNRKKQGAELGIATDAPVTQKKEPSAATAEVLKKYRPEEVDALREIFPALAEEMGFVKATDLSAQAHAQQSEAILEEFLQQHPEYSAEKDQEGLLWGRFKEEFQLYRPPANAKDYKKIFNRIHADIFGIKPAGDNGALTAAQRKIQVASHAGASGPTRSSANPSASKPRTNTSGLRLDALRGFTDEEKAEMIGGE